MMLQLLSHGRYTRNSRCERKWHLARGERGEGRSGGERGIGEVEVEIKSSSSTISRLSFKLSCRCWTLVVPFWIWIHVQVEQDWLGNGRGLRHDRGKQLVHWLLLLLLLTIRGHLLRILALPATTKRRRGQRLHLGAWMGPGGGALGVLTRERRR